jgi:hypothetical protein
MNDQPNPLVRTLADLEAFCLHCRHAGFGDNKPIKIQNKIDGSLMDIVGFQTFTVADWPYIVAS